MTSRTRAAVSGEKNGVTWSEWLMGMASSTIESTVPWISFVSVVDSLFFMSMSERRYRCCRVLWLLDILGGLLSLPA